MQLATSGQDCSLAGALDELLALTTLRAPGNIMSYSGGYRPVGGSFCRLTSNLNRMVDQLGINVLNFPFF